MSKKAFGIIVALVFLVFLLAGIVITDSSRGAEITVETPKLLKVYKAGDDSWKSLINHDKPVVGGGNTVPAVVYEQFWADSHGLASNGAIIKMQWPDTEIEIEGGTIWSNALKVCDCVKLSALTKECATKVCWQIGLKRNGQMVWRETERND